MKLIMFDYDGVLMDTFTAATKIYQDLSDEFGLGIPNDPDYLKDLLELDWRMTMKKLNLTKEHELNRNIEIFSRGLKEYSSMIRPYPGMIEVLEILSRKYYLAIVTNNMRAELDYRLEKFGMKRFFRALYSSEDGELKPSPDLAIKCMKYLDVSPKESAFVGDMDGDIQCGKSAGVRKTVAVSYGYHRIHRLEKADVLIHSPKELLDIF